MRIHERIVEISPTTYLFFTQHKIYNKFSIIYKSHIILTAGDPYSINAGATIQKKMSVEIAMMNARVATSMASSYDISLIITVFFYSLNLLNL